MKNQFWQYAYVGLGLENDGLYSRKRYSEFHQFLKNNNMDIKLANKHFSEKLMEEIKDNYLKYPGLLYRKTTYSFGTDDAQLWWVFSSISETPSGIKTKDFLANYIRPCNEVFYILLVLLVITAAIKNGISKTNHDLLFINILFLGCCLLLLFVESQGRYKYSIEPLMCIMAAFGVLNGKDLIKNVLNINK